MGKGCQGFGDDGKGKRSKRGGEKDLARGVCANAKEGGGGRVPEGGLEGGERGGGGGEEGEGEGGGSGGGKEVGGGLKGEGVKGGCG